jgi:hypothetical protein
MRQVSGTGQGAAAYGRGVAYVAENPKVSGPGESEYMKEFREHPAASNVQKLGNELLKRAYSYAMGWMEDDKVREEFLNNSGLINLSKPALQNLLGNVKTYFWTKNRVDDFKTYAKKRNDEVYLRSYEAERTRIAPIIDEVNKFLDKYYSFSDPGGPFSYKVHVYLSPETTLNWDEKFKDHHPAAQEKITLVIKRSGGSINHSSDGKTIYSRLTSALGSDYEASEALLKHGIHGIKYLDQGSRRDAPDVFLDGLKVYNGITNHTTPEFEDNRLKGKVDYKDYWGIISLPFRTAYGRIFRSIDDVRDYFYNVMRPSYPAHADEFLDWLNKNEHRLQIVMPERTYNYVVFHPDFIKAIEQYNIRGEKVRDITGVHLREVDHDPFKGEGR